jgi:tetratricopeptide (TPR) repeat protein
MHLPAEREESAMPSRKKWPSGPRRVSFLTLPLLFSIFIAGCGDGIPDFTPQELTDATAQVKEAYHLHDYEFGAELGEKWATWAPDAVELKAWTVANFCGAELSGLAASMAEEMVATHPDSPWSSFALGMVRVATKDAENSDEALDESEKALAGLPDLVDAVILRAQTLFLFLNADSAMAFAGTLSESQAAHPDLRAAMAEALFEDGLNNLPSGESGDAMYEKLREEALFAYEEILQEHPSHMTANLEAASFTDDSEKASEYLQRAVTQTLSPSAHAGFWLEIRADTALSEEDKSGRITSDFHDILENGGDSPARWAALAIALGSEGMTELQAGLDEKVLGDHEKSWAAEMILRDRIQSLAEEIWAAPSLVEGWDAQRRERLAGMLAEFIGRSQHYEPEALLGARWSAFLLERENPEADPVTLKRLADGVMAQMEIEPGAEPDWYYTLIALTLAENPATLEDARNVVDERMADLDERETPVAEAEEEGAEAEADPETQAERAVLSGLMGRVFLQEGRLDEADTELARARDLNPTTLASWLFQPLSYLYSGQLMEKRAEVARAEGADSEAGEFLRSADGFYQDGISGGYFAYPEMGMPWTNPNETALQALYEEMHGNLDGFEDYLEAAKDEGWEERRDMILADRIDDPQPMVAFALETLDGEEVTSESLLGKVAVINFWGTW